MIWNSLSDFIAMGGYGVYVWGSFWLCAIGLCLEWVLIKKHRRDVVKHLRRLALAENPSPQRHRDTEETNAEVIN